MLIRGSPNGARHPIHTPAVIGRNRWPPSTGPLAAIAQCAQTSRAMPVAAAAIGDDSVSAGRVRAARNISSVGRRTAALDRTHHLELRMTEVALHGTSPRRTVIAEDVRDLQGWASHVRRRLLRRALLARERRQLIERTDDVA